MQSFRTMIAGVTKQNTNGIDRQVLIKALSLGEELSLIREPSNPYDKYAVAVFRFSGEQLGYVPAGDTRLANHIDMGGGVSAKVVRILRGHGILSLFFSSFWKTYGCVIEITKHDLNWKEIRPYMDKSRDIEDLINTAKGLEVKEVAKAISMYREAAARIVAFDETGPVAALWPRARYPNQSPQFAFRKERSSSRPVS